MEILIKRATKTDKSTIGDMYVDGNWEAFTLEDVVREPGVKVDGKTAIPAGTYHVIVDFSQRFQKRMPHVLDVPGFEGIRIHSGNTAADTEGCLILGQVKGKDAVSQSRAAYEAFFRKLDGAKEALLTVED